VSEESGLFDTSGNGSPSHANGVSVEGRLDGFAELAKESTQLASKLRTNLNSLTESARSGGVAGAHSQITRLATGVADLKALTDRLADDERSLGLRGAGARASDLADEIQSALIKKGVNVAEGPKPYWLAYPAWFKVERTAKGFVEVVLNGDRLNTVRPSVVADRVVEALSEKFDAKQFADLLLSVRQLFRRAGASGRTLLLEDVYDVLALEPGRRVARRKEFSKGSFYYSVHRLAEEFDQLPAATMDFPTTNRSEYIFFNGRGEDRKYLTVDFTDGGLH
jgi:hypothetical protein